MKKNVALILLAIYLNAAAQSLLPWVADILAHTFNWQDHLEQVHHGHVHSHHVGVALMAEAENKADHPLTTPDFRIHKGALSAHLISAPPALNYILRLIQVLPLTGRHFFYDNIVRDVLCPPPV
jgi:hypothetical protein